MVSLSNRGDPDCSASAVPVERFRSGCSTPPWFHSPVVRQAHHEGSGCSAASQHNSGLKKWVFHSPCFDRLSIKGVGGACWVSGGAGNLEKDALQSLVGRGAGPDDVLERLIVAFAGLKRAVQHDLDLLARRLKTARQKQGLAEHDYALALPMVEVAEQHLLVNERDEPHHLQLATSRNLEVESAGNVQRLEFLHPGKRNLIVGPGARDRDRNLIVAVALEAPVVRACDMLDDIHRMTVSGY